MYVETESKIVITNDWLGKGQNLRPGDEKTGPSTGVVKKCWPQKSPPPGR